MSTIGILLFDGAEELDFVGPVGGAHRARACALERDGDRRIA